MSTYLTVGSICWDLLETEGERRLGGSARYASRVARSLGWEAVVLTSGTAELEAAARAELIDVELVVQRSVTDTAFGFDAHTELGPHRLAGRAATIDLTSPEAAALVARADLVDAVVLSESEAERLVDPEDLRRTRSVVTMGERGCVGRWGDEEIVVAGIPVDADPVATIGAGDVFAAAYFVALASGTPFPDALRKANRTAAAHVDRAL